MLAQARPQNVSHYTSILIGRDVVLSGDLLEGGAVVGHRTVVGR